MSKKTDAMSQATHKKINNRIVEEILQASNDSRLEGNLDDLAANS